MRLPLLLFTAALWPAAASAQDVERGRAIAEAWCAECHLVSPEGPGSDAAPAFAVIGALPEDANAWLRLWIMDPHPPMPRLDLTDEEISDVIAYMRSAADG